MLEKHGICRVHLCIDYLIHTYMGLKKDGNKHRGISRIVNMKWNYWRYLMKYVTDSKDGKKDQQGDGKIRLRCISLQQDVRMRRVAQLT